jgi:hypothetical protein
MDGCKDTNEKITRNCHLGKLERDGTGVADMLPAPLVARVISVSAHDGRSRLSARARCSRGTVCAAREG